VQIAETANKEGVVVKRVERNAVDKAHHLFVPSQDRKNGVYSKVSSTKG